MRKGCPIIYAKCQRNPTSGSAAIPEKLLVGGGSLLGRGLIVCLLATSAEGSEKLQPPCGLGRSRRGRHKFVRGSVARQAARITSCLTYQPPPARGPDLPLLDRTFPSTALCEVRSCAPLVLRQLIGIVGDWRPQRILRNSRALSSSSDNEASYSSEVRELGTVETAYKETSQGGNQGVPGHGRQRTQNQGKIGTFRGVKHK